MHFTRRQCWSVAFHIPVARCLYHRSHLDYITKKFMQLPQCDPGRSAVSPRVRNDILQCPNSRNNRYISPRLGFITLHQTCLNPAGSHSSGNVLILSRGDHVLRQRSMVESGHKERRAPANAILANIGKSVTPTTTANAGVIELLETPYSESRSVLHDFTQSKTFMIRRS